MKIHPTASRSTSVVFLILLAAIIPISTVNAVVLYSTGFESPTFTAGDGNLVGTDGWTGFNPSSSGGNVTSILSSSNIDAFAGQGQAAQIGKGTPAPFGSTSFVTGWEPVDLLNPVGSGKPFVTCSVDLKILPGTNGQTDDFDFTVYSSISAGNNPICGVLFSGGLNLFDSVAGTAADGATTTYAYATKYTLTIDINYITKTWTASLNGSTVINPKSLSNPVGADFGDFDAEWSLKNVPIAGNGYDYMVFDNYIITAIPEPSTYSLIGLGALGLLVWRRMKKSIAA